MGKCPHFWFSSLTLAPQVPSSLHAHIEKFDRPPSPLSSPIKKLSALPKPHPQHKKVFTACMLSLLSASSVLTVVLSCQCLSHFLKRAFALQVCFTFECPDWEKVDDKMGFIMTECGVEGASLKLVGHGGPHSTNLEALYSEGEPSCDALLLLEIKTVWFNFAAPPRTTNAHRTDFTRYTRQCLAS